MIELEIPAPLAKYVEKLGEQVVLDLLASSSRPYFDCASCRMRDFGTPTSCPFCQSADVVTKRPSRHTAVAFAAIDCELLLNAPSRAHRGKLERISSNENGLRSLSDPDGIANRREILELMKRDIDPSQRTGENRSHIFDDDRSTGDRGFDRSKLEP